MLKYLWPCSLLLIFLVVARTYNSGTTWWYSRCTIFCSI